uniref:Homeobox-containing protein n=1 Tax=Parastrongyloides trichosuri TaxID=131310 RepID=A0A0N4ZRQ9_PARTI
MTTIKRDCENIYKDNSYELHAFKPFRRCYSEKNTIFNGNRDKRTFANLSNNNIAEFNFNKSNDELINTNDDCKIQKSKISNYMNNFNCNFLNDDIERNILTAYRRVPVKILIDTSEYIGKNGLYNKELNYDDNYSSISNNVESKIDSNNVQISRPCINFDKMRASTRKCVE